MYPRFAFALLFSVSAFGLGIAIPALPVDQKCGLNAEFNKCGSACAPDCANQEPRNWCTRQCMIGCFCKDGFLKNANGDCVHPQECDAKVPHIPLHIPSAHFPLCPDNEEFQACGSACAPTCDKPNPSPLCTKNCVVGCFCKQGHLRDSRGACVPAEQCQTAQPAMLFAYPPEVSQCLENEIFMPCGSACAPTCANPNPSPLCSRQCIVGCFCKPGYLKSEQGVCVPAETCGVPASKAIPIQPQVCQANEEFRQCKGCDGTCDKPNPICPRICVQGCACKRDHVRSGPNGLCMPKEQCSAPAPASFMMMPPIPTCDKDHEMLVMDCGTRMDCMASCDTPLPFMIRDVPQIPKKCLDRMCNPSCVCIQPYVRNSDGQCVERSQCH